jgi:hypothetical protein
VRSWVPLVRSWDRVELQRRYRRGMGMGMVTRRVTRTIIIIVTMIDRDHNYNTTHKEILLGSPGMDTKLRDRENLDLASSTSMTV